MLERYSAMVLPALKEEATPTSSPAGTLKGDHRPPTNGLHVQELSARDLEKAELNESDSDNEAVEILSKQQGGEISFGDYSFHRLSYQKL